MTKMSQSNSRSSSFPPPPPPVRRFSVTHLKVVWNMIQKLWLPWLTLKTFCWTLSALTLKRGGGRWEERVRSADCCDVQIFFVWGVVQTVALKDSTSKQISWSVVLFRPCHGSWQGFYSYPNGKSFTWNFRHWILRHDPPHVFQTSSSCCWCPRVSDPIQRNYNLYNRQ